MSDSAIASAELREVHEGRLTENMRTYPLAPFLSGRPLKRYVYLKNRYPKLRQLDDAGELPPRFEQSAFCKRLVAAHGSQEAARAVRDGSLPMLSFMTGLTNKETALSEARVLMRLLSEMRRDGFLGLFVGDTDNGKTNTALWLSLLLLLDQLSLDRDVVLATNVTSLNWSDPVLEERTVFVEKRSSLEKACREYEKVVAVLDELELEANATVNNYEVNEQFGNILTFKSKEGLVLFPIFHRTDGLGAAPVIREHTSYFLKQQRIERDLDDDEYRCSFFEEHDADDGFSAEQYELPVPPLQPDGDYDPDEKASFSITD